MYTAIFLMRCFIILLHVYIHIAHAESKAGATNSAQCDKPIDLIFAVDVTSSIAKEPRRMDNMLQFIKNVMQGFNISNLKTRIAVLTFNTDITIYTELTAEKDTINKVMQNLKNVQPKSLAFTHLALKSADSIFTTVLTNSTSAKALVLLTDSSCNNKEKCPEPVENVARRLNDGGIYIFSVALSKSAVKEMKAIGSQFGNKYILVNRFPVLEDSSFASDVRNLICQVPACFCYNSSDCDIKTKRCKRIPTCGRKYFFRGGENPYTVCCNNTKVCGTGFTCDESKNKCKAMPLKILTSRSTSRSVNSELIAGVVTGMLLFILVVASLIFFFKRYRRQKATPESSQQQHVNSEFKMSSQEDVYYSAIRDTNSKPQETAGEMYVELGSGGGRIAGERTSVAESHYREVLHYDDVKKLGP